MIRQSARIAFGLYTTSLPTAVSFMILLVTIIISSAAGANSFIAKYIICRKLASLFWNSLDMPKNSVVASLRGNRSPENIRRTILVSRIRHFRGETGDVLNTRAGKWSASSKQLNMPDFLLYPLETPMSCPLLPPTAPHLRPSCRNSLHASMCCSATSFVVG